MSSNGKKANTEKVVALVATLCDLFCAFIQESQDVDSLLERLNEDDFKNKLTEVVSGAFPKRTRVTKLKDPEAPKKPLSAYMLYTARVRPGFKEQYPTAKVTELAKYMGAAWKELGPDDELKQQCLDEHKQAKQEYDELMLSYTRPDDSELIDLDCNKKKTRAKAKSESGDESTKVARKKKDPAAPTNARSAFVFFRAAKIPELKEMDENQGKTGREIASLVAELWKESKNDPEVIAEFVEQAKQDKLRHKEEMDQFNNGEFVKPPKSSPKSARSKASPVSKPVTKPVTKPVASPPTKPAPTSKVVASPPVKSAKVVASPPTKPASTSKPVAIPPVKSTKVVASPPVKPTSKPVASSAKPATKPVAVIDQPTVPEDEETLAQPVTPVPTPVARAPARRPIGTVVKMGSATATRLSKKNQVVVPATQEEAEECFFEEMD